MVGSISSLGLGSELELQSILDQLRQIDERAITSKTDQIVDLEAQLDEFTVVENKLLTMKGHALDLALNSSFLGRAVSNSDADVLGASVVDGSSASSATGWAVSEAELAAGSELSGQ